MNAKDIFYEFVNAINGHDVDRGKPLSALAETVSQG
jgi:hypothetical protein